MRLLRNPHFCAFGIQSENHEKPLFAPLRSQNSAKFRQTVSHFCSFLLQFNLIQSFRLLWLLEYFFGVKKDQSPARLGNIRMKKGRKHVFSTLTKNISILFFSFSVSFPFQHRKRNNCFTRTFHAFSFESEFAGGRAFARGPLFFKKKEKKKKEKERKGKKRKKEKKVLLPPRVRPPAFSAQLCRC